MSIFLSCKDCFCFSPANFYLILGAVNVEFVMRKMRRRALKQSVLFLVKKVKSR